MNVLDRQNNFSRTGIPFRPITASRIAVFVALLLFFVFWAMSEKAHAAESASAKPKQAIITSEGKIKLPAIKVQNGFSSGKKVIGQRETNCSAYLNMEKRKLAQGKPVVKLQVDRKSIACDRISGHK